MYTTLLTLSLLCLTADTSGPVPIVLNDDGGWCWYQDERAIVHESKVLVGSIAMGIHDASRRGDAEVTVWDLDSGARRRATLRRALGADDHNAPAFQQLPDGGVLAVYATHGQANAFWYRRSVPGDALAWGREREFVPSKTSRVTYANVFCLRGEGDRIYNFYRGFDNRFKPSYAFSDDLAQSWKNGGVFIHVPTTARHRPYVKYCSDGESTIHMVYTEGHPRDYDNSVYHVLYRDGHLLRSDGTPIATLAQGLARPEQGSRVYTGGTTHVAWVQDLHLDRQGRPVVVFSVQRDSEPLPAGHVASGQDLRYHYAYWDGHQWNQQQIAYAGTRLYPGEDDYAGLIVIDPQRVERVYLASNSDPVKGEPLISQEDGQRHYEIYRGVRQASGLFAWSPITRNSRYDNLRPVVPIAPERRSVLLWLRGRLAATPIMIWMWLDSFYTVRQPNGNHRQYTDRLRCKWRGSGARGRWVGVPYGRRFS